MDNESFFNTIKSKYESLQNFSVKENKLYLNDNGSLYIIPLTISLERQNPIIFWLKPRDIHRVIYMIELLNKQEITENDTVFINQYVNKYLDLEKKKLANMEVDEIEVFSLGIPIYLSDDPTLENNVASKQIRDIINNHLKEDEGGRTNTPRLVLTHPNFHPVNEDDDDLLANIEKAGFTTIAIILIGIVATCLYIAFFILT